MLNLADPLWWTKRRRIVRSLASAALVGVVGLASFGCADRNPPPPRVEVPPQEARDRWAFRAEEREGKPLPNQQPQSMVPPPPFEDGPLVNQRPPEQAAFVDAYNRVGRPRIVVFMNHTNVDSQFDFEAVENALTDWLSSNGQVTIIAPTTARRLMTDEQVKELQSDRSTALSDLAQRLDADILV